MSFFQKVLKTKSQEIVALDLGRGPLLGGDKAIDTEMEICNDGKGVSLPFLTLAAYFLVHS